MAKRILQAIPLIFLIVVINFAIIHLAPGDPVNYLIGEGYYDEEFVQMMRKHWGLDKPLYEQLFIHLGRLLRGDLGYSYFYRQPVLTLILERMPATLLLMVSAIVIGAIIGVLLGVYSSRKQHSPTDYSLTVLSLAGYSVPRFLIALVLLLVFGLWLGWFPISGMISLGRDYTGIDYIIDVLWHLALPVIALSTRFIALITRLTRTSMLEVLRQDFIVTARSKGLSEKTILYKHALKNALLPIITVIGINFGFTFSGAVLIETVFGWPGLGRLLYDSFYTRDYPIIMGMFVFVSVLVITVNLITDIIYAFIDPRIRYK